jgi:hypothetical protein
MMWLGSQSTRGGGAIIGGLGGGGEVSMRASRAPQRGGALASTLSSGDDTADAAARAAAGIATTPLEKQFLVRSAIALVTLHLCSLLC